LGKSVQELFKGVGIGFVGLLFRFGCLSPLNSCANRQVTFAEKLRILFLIVYSFLTLSDSSKKIVNKFNFKKTGYTKRHKDSLLAMQGIQIKPKRCPLNQVRRF